MNQQAGGLVDGDQMIIAIQDVEHGALRGADWSVEGV